MVGATLSSTVCEAPEAAPTKFPEQLAPASLQVTACATQAAKICGAQRARCGALQRPSWQLKLASPTEGPI